MENEPNNPTGAAAPVALVTGGARRIGACIVETLHGAGYRVVVHHHSSAGAAEELVGRLNARRPDSAGSVGGDLATTPADALIAPALQSFGRLDLLVNNASTFYPTPIGEIRAEHWDDLMASNARAPLFLSQAAAPALARSNGSIVNIVDVHARRPLAEHPVYCMAKSALWMLTLSLARELAPEVRVNGVAPGAILWPESGLSESEKDALIRATPLGRRGQPEDIAQAVLYLARDAGFVTGQVLSVDGGRSL